jgi:uncharacterized protein YjaZ
VIHVVFQRDTQDSFSADERDLICSIASSTEPDVRAHLPMLVPDVELSVEGRGGWEVIPQYGYGGTAMTSNQIRFIVDPSRPEGVETIVRAHLRHTLFHESHHLARGWFITAGEPMNAFIDNAVCEGLATAFERDVGGYAPGWAEYPDNVADWVEELLQLPVDANYAEWMFYNPDGRVWIGYRAGTYIADLAINNSGRSAAQLVRTPVPEVLEHAGYPYPSR